MKKTVFISSTFTDLQNHRRKIWDVLSKYDISIRGMERFGARTETPIQTCLSEVEQSDLFVCVIGCRLGSIGADLKSMVQLEYERALKLNKEIFIYFIDEHYGKVSPDAVDSGENYERLKAFKSLLQERHTIDKFIDENDLAEKLKRKFDEVLSKKIDEQLEIKDEYRKSHELLEKFLLLPAHYSGKEVKLKIKLDGKPFPASKSVCNNFGFSYGNTIGVKIKLIQPNIKDEEFQYIFALGKKAEQLLNIDPNKEIEIYASISFSENYITNERARYVNSYGYCMNMAANPNSLYFLDNSFLGRELIAKADGGICLSLTDVVDPK